LKKLTKQEGIAGVVPQIPILTPLLEHSEVKMLIMQTKNQNRYLWFTLPPQQSFL